MKLWHRGLGFSLAELLVVLAILGLIVPVALQKKAYSEEELAAQEAENLARWFRSMFARADATGQAFSVVVENSIPKPDVTIFWLDSGSYSPYSKTKDIYPVGGGALFSNFATNIYIYRPSLNAANPFGMTIRVHKKFEKGYPVRYVIISRFGRVRISIVDVVNYDDE